MFAPPMMSGSRMQAVVDRVALVERVDNGLIVRYREPVEGKHKPPTMPRLLRGYPGTPPGFPGEEWQGQSDDEQEVKVWVLELRAVYCKDEEDALPVLRKAREFNQKIRDLRRQGEHVVEEQDDGPAHYLACR